MPRSATQTLLPSYNFTTLQGWPPKPSNQTSAAAAKSLQSCPTVQPYRRQPTRLPRPWNSLGKNTGVGCHFLLQCMKVKSESEVTQLCPTLRDPMDCSLPGSSVHGIFQARVLEWVVAKAFYEPKVKTPLLYFEPQSIRDAYKRKWLRSSQKGDGENK